MRRRTLIVLAIVPALLLAGCASSGGPPVSSRDVPQDAPTEGGDGEYALGIRILDEPGGDPIAGAPVVVYWGDSGGSFDGEVSGGASNSADGQHANGVVRVSGDVNTPEPDTTIPLRTGPDGIAVANVPNNRVVGIVASATGFTEEWLPAVATGGSNGTGTLDIPVYRSEITYTVDGTWGPGGASPARLTDSNYQWQAEEVQWGASQAALDGYVDRLASLRMTITWTNGPSGGGDLALGAGTSSVDPDVVQDSDGFQGAPGEQTDELVLDAAGIVEHGWPSAETLYVGPATETAYVAPNGLDYQIEVTATFDTFTDPDVGVHGEARNDSPAPGLALVGLLGITGVALRPRGKGQR